MDEQDLALVNKHAGCFGNIIFTEVGLAAFLAERDAQHADKALGHGRTLRDWFAGRVCSALLTTTSADTKLPNLDYKGLYDEQTVAERVASISYQMADAMLKERKDGE